MEEMIGESIRPHVEMMSTAEKIKEAFSTLDSINLQKFDLVSKAMAVCNRFCSPINQNQRDNSEC